MKKKFFTLKCYRVIIIHIKEKRNDYIMKDIYSTKTFSCPDTGSEVVGVYVSELNELKFRVANETEETEEIDWDTVMWCEKNSTKKASVVEANEYLKKYDPELELV
ncbi:hypothetical protein EBB07_29215 [Paenibacillaceae bacterium]|nr:hypothetical protein EBB07_29215 [Paenibacillaceae bacterium]